MHPDTAIDRVHLTVSDLERSIRFYEDLLGFRTHRRHGDEAALGAGGRDLLVLQASPQAPRARRTTGLYHFAILVPARLALAQSLRRLAEHRTPMQGFADHGVSEAIYLADPDGIGIEVYRDRPRAEWPIAKGQLQMVSDPLDVEGLLREAEADAVRPDATPWTGLAPETRIGHVHLHVSFLEDTERFYVGGLGLTLTQRFGASALFLAAGGYHHHIGANTWAGVGAPRPPAGAVGLKHFVISVPDAAALSDVAGRLRAAGAGVDDLEDAIGVEDPAGNRIIVQTVP